MRASFLPQADLYKFWLPGVTQSELITGLSHFRKLVSLRFVQLPFMPLRETVLLGYGDVYSKGQVCASPRARASRV